MPVRRKHSVGNRVNAPVGLTPQDLARLFPRCHVCNSPVAREGQCDSRRCVEARWAAQAAAAC